MVDVKAVLERWRKPESPPLNQNQLWQAIRNGARSDCADEIESALAALRDEVALSTDAMNAALDKLIEHRNGRLAALERAARLEAENARLREDAEKWQWLRENVYPHAFFDRQQPHVVMAVYLGHDSDGRLLVMHPGKESNVGIPSLDQAIDAARAALAEKEGGHGR